MKTSFITQVQKTVDVEVHCPEGYYILEGNFIVKRNDKYYRVSKQKWENINKNRHWIGLSSKSFSSYFCRKIKITPMIDLLNKQYVGKICFYEDAEYKIVRVYSSKYSNYTLCELESRTLNTAHVNIVLLSIIEES